MQLHYTSISSNIHGKFWIFNNISPLSLVNFTTWSRLRIYSYSLFCEMNLAFENSIAERSNLPLLWRYRNLKQAEGCLLSIVMSWCYTKLHSFTCSGESDNQGSSRGIGGEYDPQVFNFFLIVSLPNYKSQLFDSQMPQKHVRLADVKIFLLHSNFALN